LAPARASNTANRARRPSASIGTIQDAPAMLLPANTICLLALTLFCGLLLWAAISDLRHYIIPNQVSIALLALFPVYAASAPAPVQWLWALALAAGFFAVCFAMYLARALGAGDAKLPVVVLWAGPKNITLPVVALTLSSVLLAVIMGARAALLRSRADESPQDSPGATAVESSALARAQRAFMAVGYLRFLKVKLPYGVAIAASGIVVAVNAAFTLVR
jgi:prepilin peptidase CpaA